MKSFFSTELLSISALLSTFDASFLVLKICWSQTLGTVQEVSVVEIQSLKPIFQAPEPDNFLKLLCYSPELMLESEKIKRKTMSLILSYKYNTTA
jgi:hypothetical protein